MKMLQIHNYYITVGGENMCVQDEARLLREHGHDVVEYSIHNQLIHEQSYLKSLKQAFWNNQAAQEVSELIERERPDVAHITNTFPLMSPSIYFAVHQSGVPIVQSVRNYRFACPKGISYRANKVCESCVNKRIKWPAIYHRCYQGHVSRSAVASGIVSMTSAMKVWQKTVDRYIAISPIVQEKLIEFGIPSEQITLKPEFIEEKPVSKQTIGNYAVFAGRLVQAKGILTMLEAWKYVNPEIRLLVIGTGDLTDEVQKAASECENIEYLGYQPLERVMELISGARVTLFPSEWNETFGRTIMESFSYGVPVIASKIGSMKFLIQNGVSGLHFEVANASDFANKVELLFQLPEQEYAEMRRRARQRYEELSTPEKSYKQLMAIYESVIKRSHQSIAA